MQPNGEETNTDTNQNNEKRNHTRRITKEKTCRVCTVIEKEKAKSEWAKKTRSGSAKETGGGGEEAATHGKCTVIENETAKSEWGKKTPSGSAQSE